MKKPLLAPLFANPRPRRSRTLLWTLLLGLAAPCAPVTAGAGVAWAAPTTPGAKKKTQAAPRMPKAGTPAPAPAAQSPPAATEPPPAATAPPATAAQPPPAAAPAQPAPATPPDQPAAASTAPSLDDEDLETRLRRFEDALAKGVERLGTHPRYLSIAVLPFVEHGERTRKQRLGLLLGYTVRAALARDYGLRVVPPAAVREALKGTPEGKDFDPATARSLGQRVHASVVILGNVSDAGDHFAIAASVLATSGAQEPLEHRLVRVRATELLDAAEDSQVLRTKGNALWRSALLPGWGQIYNRQYVKGIVVATLELGLLASAITYEVLGHQAESRYGWDLRRTASERATAHDDYLTGNILLALAAGVWVYGGLDAYLSGADPDEAPTLVATGPQLQLLPLVALTGVRPAASLLGAVARLRF